MQSDDLPDQCVVFDTEFAQAPFYLRVKVKGGIDQVELHDREGPVLSLPAAIEVSFQKGYAPTHWLTYPGNGLNAIAAAVLERLALQYPAKSE